MKKFYSLSLALAVTLSAAAGNFTKGVKSVQDLNPMNVEVQMNSAKLNTTVDMVNTPKFKKVAPLKAAIAPEAVANDYLLVADNIFDAPDGSTFSECLSKVTVEPGSTDSTVVLKNFIYSDALELPGVIFDYKLSNGQTIPMVKIKSLTNLYQSDDLTLQLALIGKSASGFSLYSNDLEFIIYQNGLGFAYESDDSEKIGIGVVAPNNGKYSIYNALIDPVMYIPNGEFETTVIDYSTGEGTVDNGICYAEDIPQYQAMIMFNFAGMPNMAIVEYDAEGNGEIADQVAAYYYQSSSKKTFTFYYFSAEDQLDPDVNPTTVNCKLQNLGNGKSSLTVTNNVWYTFDPDEMMLYDIQTGTYFEFDFEFEALPGFTGITNVTVADENAPVEYYNLQGVKVANPQNGLYIRRQGNQSTKVLVK